jgi:hypothetical protein
VDLTALLLAGRLVLSMVRRTPGAISKARDFLNEEATTEEIDEEIQNELEAWND